MPPSASLAVTPQLVASPALGVLSDVAREPERYAIEPKVDGIRCLVVYLPDGTIETRNRRGEPRGWLRHPSFAAASVASPTGCRSSGGAPYLTAS